MASNAYGTVNPRKEEQASKKIETYILEGILPDGCTLTLNREQRILTVIDFPCGITAQSILTPCELLLIETLIVHFPHYAPLEALHSVYTGTPVEDSREVIHRAYAESNSQQVLHPVRNLMNLCRKKLRPLGIEVRDILETGYALFPYRPRSASSDREVSA